MMILLIGLGILLLFPGLCSLAIIVYLADINPKNLLDEGLLVGLWLATFLVAAGGVLLIRHAIRGRAV
jgi:hypothetical protein